MIIKYDEKFYKLIVNFLAGVAGGGILYQPFYIFSQKIEASSAFSEIFQNFSESNSVLTYFNMYS